MAQYSAAVNNWTPTATADGSVLTNSGYHAVGTLNATRAARIIEVEAQGLSTTSTANNLAVRRSTTNGATPTNRVPAPVMPYSGASNFGSFITAATAPTCAALATVQHVLEMGLNGNGGINRWVAAPGSEIWILTASANNSEVTLAGVTGTPGPVNSHYIVEEI